MSISIFTIIDDDITINESIQEYEDTCTQSKMIDKNNNECSSIYDYLIKIVSTYSNYRILMYLVLYTDSNIYYIRLYNNYE